MINISEKIESIKNKIEEMEISIDFIEKRIKELIESICTPNDSLGEIIKKLAWRREKTLLMIHIHEFKLLKLESTKETGKKENDYKNCIARTGFSYPFPLNIPPT
jgi:hypothetical protein